MRKFFIVFFLIFLNTVFVNAQGTTDYRFLEVVDFAGKPVAGAMIDLRGACSTGKQTTNEKGALERFPIGGGDCGSLNDFTISKDGYFSFRDIGLFSAPYNDIYRERFVYNRSENRDKYKIELLKIPINKAERKAVGDEEKKRELFWAVRDKDSGAVRGLLKSGISPTLNTSDLRGVSGPKNIPAIMFAAASGDSETIKIFLKSKIKPRRVETPEHSLLRYFLAAQPKLFWRRSPPAPSDDEKARALREFEAGVKSLIAAGARLYKLDADGANALMIAAGYSAYTNIARMLLERGLPINARDDKGKTALYYANPYYDYEMIKLLLEAGADPNVVPEDDCSFLMQAIVANNFSNDGGGETLDVIKLLVKYKADVNFTCNGENALRLAGRPEVKKLLRDAGAK